MPQVGPVHDRLQSRRLLLPETDGYDAYLYADTEQPVVFSSLNAGRVNVRQFNGVDSTDSILPQEDFTALILFSLVPVVSSSSWKA